MSEVDSVGPFWVHQEWPGRHVNIDVRIAVNEYTIYIRDNARLANLFALLNKRREFSIHDVKASTTWREVR